MRFIKSVIKLLVFIGLVLGVVYAVGPEIVVGLSAMELRNQVEGLKALVAKPGEGPSCQDPLSSGKEKRVSAYQIRFINESQYEVEAVCSSVTKGSVTISKHQLGYKVGKLPGYSGIKWLIDREVSPTSWVIIGGWGRNWQVGVVEGKVVAKRLWQPVVGEETDVVDSTCQGWGYVCCSEVNQVGDGQKMSTHVLDCPNSCFPACWNRPAVTSLITEPYFDENRLVRLAEQNPSVDFSWRAQDQDGTVSRILIDFGDGTNEEATTGTGTVTHGYQCSGGVCVYLVRVTAWNELGLESAETLNSKVTVVVGD